MTFSTANNATISNYASNPQFSSIFSLDVLLSFSIYKTQVFERHEGEEKASFWLTHHLSAASQLKFCLVIYYSLMRFSGSHDLFTPEGHGSCRRRCLSELKLVISAAAYAVRTQVHTWKHTQSLSLSKLRQYPLIKTLSALITACDKTHTSAFLYAQALAHSNQLPTI